MNLPSSITTIPRSEYYQGMFEDDTSDMEGYVYLHAGKHLLEYAPFKKGLVIYWHSRKLPSVDQTLENVKRFLTERPSWYMIATVYELLTRPASRLIEHPYIYRVTNFPNFPTDQLVNDISKYWDYGRAHITFTDHNARAFGSFWFNMSKGNWAPRTGVYLDERPIPKEFVIAYMAADIDFLEPEVLRQILNQTDT